MGGHDPRVVDQHGHVAYFGAHLGGQGHDIVPAGHVAPEKSISWGVKTRSSQ